TNLAARLQQIAEPGAILLSEATARLVAAETDLEPLPPVRVKGRDDLVQACRVLETEGAVSRRPLHAVSGGFLSPFVGRRGELATLEELAEQAAAGQGQVVGIAGEAGSGKSRLLHEFHLGLDAGPGAALSGRCLSYGAGVPYLPFLSMLRGAWGLQDADTPETLTVKLRRGLESLGSDPEASAYLLHLLRPGEADETLGGLEPLALQARTFAAVRQTLLAAAARHLVVIEIEDLHWIDETSEELLAGFIEGLAAARVLLLLTYRSGYQPHWMEKSYATQITMRRLSPTDSHAVVEAVLRRAELSGELTHRILERADGNPFFLEELTRALLDHSTPSHLVIPETIQGVLMARIDRLPESHKRLLQAASVLGREFAFHLLTSLWEEPSHAEALLADLKRWEFLYEDPAAHPPAYFFKHALTQEAVYQSLLTARREALHTAAGRALETLYGDRLEEVYDLLAHHYARSSETGKAVHYLMRFAEQAARANAHAEAARALGEALPLAEHTPEDRRDRQVAEILLALADSLLPLARFPETLELLLAQRGRIERLNDPALAGRYHFWLAHTLSYLGRQEEAAAAAHQAIADSLAAGDPVTQGKACFVLGRDGFWSGRFTEGIRFSLEAVELLAAGGESWWRGQADWVAGFNHYVLGQFDQALA
ncbi:MAG: AAA family ATPase, partial [Acidobacteriota bacterium]|nr:AAA family ATPase [Acidobacteriota bacterium]